MYLQEMLFFEGQEKSLQMFTEEELREYGEIYKELSLDFENNIGYLIEDYANRTNRAGERVHYGIYNHEHPIDDTHKIKIHSNGENINKSENNQLSDLNDSMNTFKVDASYLDTNEFKNGVTIKYAKTNGKADGESNFKDILTVVSMLIDQKQSKNESTVDIKSKVPELIKRLYRISHTYTGESTELYGCEKGCRVLYYYCNEVDNGDKGYAGTGIDLQPFPINPHSDFDDYEYEDEDFELFEPEGECELCGHNGKGCELDSKKCYHGNTNTMGEGILGNMGGNYGDCLKYVAVPLCTYEGDEDHDHDEAEHHEEAGEDHHEDESHNEESSHQHGGDSSHEEHEEADEHVWTSPVKAAEITEAIAEKMAEIDPVNAESYIANAREYEAQILDLDARFREIVENAELKTIVFGDRFPIRYFAEEYGLEYYAAFPGCSSETEPSASTLAFLIDKVREEQIPVVFSIEFSNGNIARAICESSGAVPGTFYSCHNLTKEQMENGETYVTMMTENLKVLQEALGRKAEER